MNNVPLDEPVLAARPNAPNVFKAWLYEGLHELGIMVGKFRRFLPLSTTATCRP